MSEARRERANNSSASASSADSSRPRFALRRMIPAAARADSENRGGAVGVRMSSTTEGENEHPSSSLGHSEVLSVENPVGPPVPEFPQATEERPKVAAGIAGEESRNVLEEDGGRSVSLHKVEEGEGEAGPGAGESSPLSCDAEILAGEAAGPEVGIVPTMTV